MRGHSLDRAHAAPSMAKRQVLALHPLSSVALSIIQCCLHACAQMTVMVASSLAGCLQELCQLPCTHADERLIRIHRISCICFAQ